MDVRGWFGQGVAPPRASFSPIRSIDHPKAMSTALIADRFEVLDSAGEGRGGRVFRARDWAFDEVVAVKPLTAFAAGASGLDELGAQIRRLQRHPHAALVRYEAFDPRRGMLVREWVHGIALIDLLKRRRELRAAEAMRLLGPLPAILDFAAGRGLALPGLLGKVIVQFAAEADPTEIAGRPLDRWPACALKLNPLSVGAFLVQGGDETATVTAVELAARASAAFTAPQRLAELLYELLGGSPWVVATQRYSPLPALNEEGNEVLRRALMDGAFADCQGLWSELEEAAPSGLRALPALGHGARRGDVVFQLPAALRQPVEPARVLRLSPISGEAAPIALLARTQITIGRSLQQADVVVRCLPESAENEARTNQMGRIHAVAEANESGLWLRDGNGSEASVNGTLLDGHELSASVPAALRHRALLTLGGVFSVAVIPLLAEAGSELEILGDESPRPTEPAPPLGGAVFFTSAETHPLVREVVWIFSEAGFGLDALQRIVWDTRGAQPSPAAFHFHRGGFWVSNQLAEPGIVQVENIELQRGEIAPLRAGHVLQIGSGAGAARYVAELG